MKTILSIVTVALTALSLTTAHAGGSVAAGKQVYLHQCSGCHSNVAGVDRFGPSLAGVYGRKAGTAPRHRYSPAMTASHIVWNATTLNGFLENPRGYLHGTRMPYRGLASATARANVIAYLKSISPH